RNVYPLWLDAGIAVDVVATAFDEGSVRVAVLGPLRNGRRDVIASGGYSTPRSNVELTIETTERSEYLVVVGSHRLESATSYQLTAHCPDCTSEQTDVLAVPKAGALVGTGGIVSMQLGNVLADRDFDIEVELWASPPAQWWNGTKVATSVASGTQVNVIVPSTVAAADDLRLVVREAGGRVLDTGVVTRFAPVLAPMVRTDALLYGDLVSVGASGIAGAFEGVISLSLRSEVRAVTIADADIYIDLPGQVGNGFNAFDAAFNPELFDEQGTLNPNLPTNGELLSIGTIDGNGGYRRMGCFEYCNDLSGQETCTGGPRTCP
ncbi:MAG: hypothetical protein H0V17_21735, partial [Deltaproteobacteria bacterium]|nr:hypothetical protein [Deltaproteobacteria bacterium]